MTDKEHTIFFAWQSDSPAPINRNAIRLALAQASSALEADRPGLTLKIDEATRDMIGADDVPRSIRDKIEAADIFVGDVTTVTQPPSSDGNDRPCPNPNVTFEIGYAAAHIGWNRMILLTNLAIAKFEDLPFDFDRHRVSQFRVKPGSEPKGIERLTKLLTTAIAMILDGTPSRPAELRIIDPAQIRRKRDIEAARWALSQIAIPAIQEHIEYLPHTVQSRDFYYYYSYHGVISNALFHINDPALDAAFRGLDAAWGEALSYGENYTDASGERYVFSSPGDAPLSSDGQSDWDSILAARDDMHRHLHAVLAMVREHYVEIDVLDTNRKAFEQWQHERAETRALWTNLDNDDD
ncbi:hypothetical protein [Sagittula salina]|uniref:CD-NTase-associated protein 12/Pycsar effector protein TIR domain-containing protein n=1 Tax=Sagittula salina TaxID=2820268 RepID=A0A940MV11_9RHOB|nr:hypothetical protein [Sagittula salina]MBP0485153.1 hypothetical protein [Sagittula salina]